MPAAPDHPWRILWVDTEVTTQPLVLRHLQAQGLRVRSLSSFEQAVPQVRTWAPHLLVLDYVTARAAMCYETFVHVELPLTDPYRTGGPLAANPWGHRAVPLVLTAGGSLAATPGYMIPHLTRATRFLAKPYDPVHLVHVVKTLLPLPVPGLVVDLVRGVVELEGVPHRVSPRGLDLLALLVRCHPRPCPAALLVQHLWEAYGVTTSETSVRMRIQALRRVLESDPAQPRLLCNAGQGYFLTQQPRLRTAPDPRSSSPTQQPPYRNGNSVAPHARDARQT